MSTINQLNDAASKASPRAANSEHGEPTCSRPLSDACTSADNGDEPPFLPLRYGFDSLYLSYRGEMLPEAKSELERLKAYAQNKDQEHMAQALAEGHIFSVSDKGRGRYRYVLSDATFDIQLCDTPSASIPVAYVRVRSQTLATMLPLQVEAHLREVISRFCILEEEEAKVSRADLFLDFCYPDEIIRTFQSIQFVTRAEVVRPYFTNLVLNAWDIGLGGDVSARLYDKILELAKSGKHYLKPLWVKAGWDGQKTVWRLEFQLRRPILAQMNITTLRELDIQRGMVWTYLNKEWLRIVIPNPQDKTRARWKTHPLSEYVWDGGCGSLDQPMMRKLRTDQAPSLSETMQRLCAPLSTLLADVRCESTDDAVKWISSNLEKLLKQEYTTKAVRMDCYLLDLIKKKIRKFNLWKNDNDLFGRGRF